MFSRLEAKDFMKLLLLQKQNETQKKKKISEILHSKSHACLVMEWHEV